MGVSPIVYELVLVVGGLVAFVVWQTVTLRRDMRITQQRKAVAARRERDAAESTASDGGRDGPTDDPPVVRK
jgi:hypothetical protein